MTETSIRSGKTGRSITVRRAAAKAAVKAAEKQGKTPRADLVELANQDPSTRKA